MWDLIVSVPDHCLSFYFRYNHHKVQNGDRSRQDENDDKQPKWLPKRDQA